MGAAIDFYRQRWKQYPAQYKQYYVGLVDEIVVHGRNADEVIAYVTESGAELVWPVSMEGISIPEGALVLTRVDMMQAMQKSLEDYERGCL